MRSYGTRSWFYNYICNQCLSSLILWFQIPLRRGVLDTILYDKNSPGQPVHHHCFHYYLKAKPIALVSSSLLSEKHTLSITMVTINYHHDNNTSGITFLLKKIRKRKDRCLSIVLSVLLRYTDSDYPFGIFKLFFYNRSISVILITSILLFYVTFRYICNSLLIVGLAISQKQLLM